MAKRILVISSEPSMRRDVCDSLASLTLHIDTAADGPTGLQKVTQWDYGAVVLDCSIPQLDGEEVRTQLRAMKRTPVLMLMTLERLRTSASLAVTDIDDFVIAPPQPEELRDRLQRLVERPVRPSLVQFGDVVVNTILRTVTRGQNPVPLTAKEYALVELVALHGKSAVTRCTIMKTLHEGEDISNDRRVDGYIASIRKKMGQGCIRSRRGYGFVAECHSLALRAQPAPEDGVSQRGCQ